MALTQFSHTYGTTWTDGTNTLSGSVTQTADSERYFDQTITSTGSLYNTAGSTSNTGMLITSAYTSYSSAIAAATLAVIPTKSIIGFFAVAQNIVGGGSVSLYLGAASNGNTTASGFISTGGFISLQNNIPQTYVAPYNGATTVTNPLTGWATTTAGVTCFAAHDITALSLVLAGGATSADVRIRFLIDSSVTTLTA